MWNNSSGPNWNQKSGGQRQESANSHQITQSLERIVNWSGHDLSTLESSVFAPTHRDRAIAIASYSVLCTMRKCLEDWMRRDESTMRTGRGPRNSFGSTAARCDQTHSLCLSVSLTFSLFFYWLAIVIFVYNMQYFYYYRIHRRRSVRENRVLLLMLSSRIRQNNAFSFSLSVRPLKPQKT